MKHHSELLNFIAKKINAKTYVEIGVYNPAHNFVLIEVDKKFGVDPDRDAGANCRMTSDQFFEFMIAAKALVDLVWIDGLHHEDQVRRDMENAWLITKPGGVIAVHDCNPPTEETTCVPRGSQREWCGDVYRAICALMLTRNNYFTVDFDYGCCVIKKERSDISTTLIFPPAEFTWQEFDNNRKEMINLIPIDEALSKIESWNIVESIMKE